MNARITKSFKSRQIKKSATIVFVCARALVRARLVVRAMHVKSAAIKCCYMRSRSHTVLYESQHSKKGNKNEKRLGQQQQKTERRKMLQNERKAN